MIAAPVGGALVTGSALQPAEYLMTSQPVMTTIENTRTQPSSTASDVVTSQPASVAAIDTILVGSPGSRTWAALPQEAQREMQNINKTSWDFIPPVQEPVLPVQRLVDGGRSAEGGMDSAKPQAVSYNNSSFNIHYSAFSSSSKLHPSANSRLHDAVFARLPARRQLGEDILADDRWATADLETLIADGRTAADHIKQSLNTLDGLFAACLLF